MAVILPYTQQVAAYEWLDRTLRADPQLRVGVKTLITRVPGGETDDDDPTAASCPWIRLTPEPEQSAPFCRYAGATVYRADLLIQVETCVAGDSPADSQRLGAAFHGALKPFMGNASRTFSAGISDILALRIPSTGLAPPAGDGLLYATGSYRLVLFV